ncbi:efflux RND transporter periplasmic adaptor subunit [Streptosporangium sp. NBC_01639]|uniref:efflux RND transporter periplasmic adaptor subunit n=1 Tax=Streptosporangium sp. NBC_01639 TaxID=2975948 RepID=UPI00386D2F5E|nr:efflux RND transporter periplasmic adaptor subunit [Streptosporangium sp. NBC_01639]
MRPTNLPKPLRTGGLALAALVLVGAGVLYTLDDGPSSAPRVELASAKRGTVTAQVSAAGNTVDDGTRELAFGGSGTVTKVYVRAGEKVEKGDVLARIGSAPARERHAEAVARLSAAQEALDGAETAATAQPQSQSQSQTQAQPQTQTQSRTSNDSARQAACEPTARPTGMPSPNGTSGPTGTARPTGTPGPVLPSTPAGSERPVAVVPAAYSPPSIRTPAPTPTPVPTPTGGSPEPAPTVTVTVTAAPTVTVTATATATVTVTATPSASRPPTSAEPTRPGPAPSLSTQPSAHPAPTSSARPTSTAKPHTTSKPRPTSKPTVGRTPESQSTACPGQSSDQRSAQTGGTGRTDTGGTGGTGGTGRTETGGTGGQRTLSVEQAEADVKRAEAELTDAKEELAGVRIIAPADGTVLSVAGAVGDSVGTDAFVTLGDLDELQVEALVTESDVGRLKLGQPAAITLATREGKKYTGTVTGVAPTATATGQLVRYGVTIAFDKAPADLLVGQTATVSVTVAESEQALYLPAQAVRSATGGASTVTVQGGAERTVKTGVRSDQYVEILSGLGENDRVVLPGGTATGGFPDSSWPGGS